MRRSAPRSPHRRWRRACRRLVSCTATRSPTTTPGCAPGRCRAPGIPGRRARLIRRSDRAPERAGRNARRRGRGRIPTGDEDSVAWPLTGTRIGRGRRPTATTCSCCARRPGRPRAGGARREPRRATHRVRRHGGPSSPAPTGPCWRGRPTSAARRTTSCASATWRPGGPAGCDRPERARVAWSADPGTCSTSCPTSCPGCFRSGGTGSGPRRARTSSCSRSPISASS